MQLCDAMVVMLIFALDAADIGCASAEPHLAGHVTIVAWPNGGVKHGETGARRRQGAVLAAGPGTLAIKRAFRAGLLRAP
jgi:hypothetical protein